MFDTTLLSKRGKYSYRGESLTFSHSEETKRGSKIYIFKSQQGASKRITQTNCQKNFWEEIEESPKFQELLAKSENSTNKVHLPKIPQS